MWQITASGLAFAGLLGLAHAEPAADATSAPPSGLTSRAYRTWIWPKPSQTGHFLGYMRVGQRVALRSSAPVRQLDCPRGYYAIEPRGYVCHDRTVTLDKNSAFLRANAATLPATGPFPYRYALSNGAPMYSRIPTATEQRRTEWRYGPAGKFLPLPMFQRGHEHLAVVGAIPVRDALPAFLQGGGSARKRPMPLLVRSIPHGAMLSFTRSFEVEGRTFLLSADLTVVPADRVRAFRRSSFKGRVLNGAVKLPLAWFRYRDRPQYQRGVDGRIAPSGEHWPVRSSVMLGEEVVEQEKQRFLAVVDETGQKRGFVDAVDATVVRRRARRPFGVRPGEKWILVSISQGTLVAYEDLEPVYATLMSPGQGGLPRKGGDLVKDSTTPLGAYRITFKDRAATMSPEMGEQRSFWIADVPFTQYFSPPFALHASYWHEKFGELMSGGCINVSPIDAAHLFNWTGPPVPAGWQGVSGAGAKKNGAASMIVVTR